MFSKKVSAGADRIVVSGHSVFSVKAKNELATQSRRAYSDLATALPDADACRDAGISITGIATTPDFHPGKPVPVGIVADIEGGILPHWIGNDIGCGMRMLVLKGLSADDLKPGLDQHLRHIFFQGGRDIALTGRQRMAMLQEGIPGLLESTSANRLGLMAPLDFAQAWKDLESVSDQGMFAAAGIEPDFASYASLDDGVRYDAICGTLGGGNHFAEIGVVDRIADGGLANATNLHPNDVVLIIHSGSLDFGQRVGSLARSALHTRKSMAGDHRLIHFERDRVIYDRFILGQANAVNAAFANRFFLGLMAIEAIRRASGKDVAGELVYDAPHNAIWPGQGGGEVARHRKGACPAEGPGMTESRRYKYLGEPVILPGSMGDGSWLLSGTGKTETLASSAHGAGRRLSRQEARAVAPLTKGLRVVGPVDFNDQQIKGRSDIIGAALGRLQEEAPAAYRPIDDVVDAMVDAGMVKKGVKIKPLVTVKG